MNERGITSKQSIAIMLIERNLPRVKFRGDTLRQASEFINEYMQESLAVDAKRKKMYNLNQALTNEDNYWHLRRFEKEVVMPDISIAYFSDDGE